MSLAALASLLVTPVLGWTDIPDRIPHHFGPTGQPTAWTDRAISIFPAVLGVVIYVGLTLLNRIPHLFNYPWPITEQNAAIQYQLARSLVTWLKLVIVGMFAYLLWGTLEVAEGGTDRIHPLAIVAFLLALHVIIGIFVYRMYRHRNDASR
jgi:uncharacterized membrane protein